MFRCFNREMSARAPRHLVSDSSIRAMAGIRPGARTELYGHLRGALDDVLADVLDEALRHMRQVRQMKTLRFEDVQHAMARHMVSLDANDPCMNARRRACSELVQSKVKKTIKLAIADAVRREAAQRLPGAAYANAGPPVIDTTAVRGLYIVYQRLVKYIADWAELLRRHSGRVNINNEDATLARAIFMHEFKLPVAARDVNRLAVPAVPTAAKAKAKAPAVPKTATATATATGQAGASEPAKPTGTLLTRALKIVRR